jgi:ribosomal protein S18 acetylase RimI-like enzyme
MTAAPVSVAPGARDDAATIAALHRAVFPEYRTARLGPAFTRALFERFIASPHVTVLVARHGGEIIGYCIAGEQPILDAIRRTLLPHALIGAVLNARATIDAAALASVAQTARRLVRRVLARVRNRSGAATADDAAALSHRRTILLHLIGVAPAARGLGAGSALLAAFETAFALRYDDAVLSVRTDNLAARRLYEAFQWAADPHAPDATTCVYRRRYT